MKIRQLWLAYTLAGILFASGCGGDQSNHHTTASPVSATMRPTQAEATAAKVPQPPVTSQPQMQAGEFLDLVPPQRPAQEMELVAMPVLEAPTVDGHAQESVWSTAPAITTLDFSSQRPITLQSVYTTDHVFFLVTYPDQVPSETHKTWQWDAKERIYKEGPDREDMFLFKWSLVGNDVSLALRNPEPHHADIWFWKAQRGNPSGYADDKWQSFSREPRDRAQTISTSGYGKLYFRREGDAGKPAWEEKTFYEYQGESLAKFYPAQPQGSRGDIRARGVWHNGQWTIEFARKLTTGHDDDVALAPGSVFLFAVTCYEMARDDVDPAVSQPIYRTGDAFDRLLFRLKPRSDL